MCSRVIVGIVTPDELQLFAARELHAGHSVDVVAARILTAAGESPIAAAKALRSAGVGLGAAKVAIDRNLSDSHQRANEDIRSAAESALDQ